MAEGVSHNPDDKVAIPVKSQESGWRSRFPGFLRGKGQRLSVQESPSQVTPPVETEKPPRWESSEQAVGELLSTIGDTIGKRDSATVLENEALRQRDRRMSNYDRTPLERARRERDSGYATVQEALMQMRDQFGDFVATVGEGNDQSLILRVPQHTEQQVPLYAGNTIREAPPQSIIGTVDVRTTDYLLVNGATISLLRCTTERGYTPDDTSPAYEKNFNLKKTLADHAAKFGPKVANVGKAAAHMIELTIGAGHVLPRDENVREDFLMAGEKVNSELKRNADEYRYDDQRDEATARLRNLLVGQQPYTDSWDARDGVVRRKVTQSDLPEIKKIVEESMTQAVPPPASRT